MTPPTPYQNARQIIAETGQVYDKCQTVRCRFITTINNKNYTGRRRRQINKKYKGAGVTQHVTHKTGEPVMLNFLPNMANNFLWRSIIIGAHGICEAQASAQ